MKLVNEYLADAANFEQLAKTESDPAMKERLLKQAAAYRKLADKRSATTAPGVPSDSTERK